MIPNFIEGGILPPGIHEANIDEIAQIYGGAKSRLRSQRFKSLKEFLQFIQYHAIEIYVDGSFITSKLSPSDVDLLIVLPSSFYQNVQAMFRLSHFTTLSRSYRLHIFAYPEGHEEISRKMDWFTHTRPPRREKGIIKVKVRK